MEVSKQEFQQGDLRSAHHILRGGADNAYNAFISVLALTDSPEAKQGLLAMVSTYADWAAVELESGDTLEAKFATCEGLKIHPRHKRLNEIKEDLSARLSPEQPAIDC